MFIKHINFINKLFFSIKKILMGHSLKGDVDLNHYNAQSEEDLKKIYDKVMPDNILAEP